MQLIVRGKREFFLHRYIGFAEKLNNKAIEENLQILMKN